MGNSRHNDKVKKEKKGRNIGKGYESYLEYIAGLFEPLKVTYQDPLTNYFNLNYLGELYMGSNEQKFMVVWDTGSGSLLLKSSLCSGC